MSGLDDLDKTGYGDVRQGFKATEKAQSTDCEKYGISFINENDKHFSRYIFSPVGETDEPRFGKFFDKDENKRVIFETLQQAISQNKDAGNKEEWLQKQFNCLYESIVLKLKNQWQDQCSCDQAENIFFYKFCLSLIYSCDYPPENFPNKKRIGASEFLHKLFIIVIGENLFSGKKSGRTCSENKQEKHRVHPHFDDKDYNDFKKLEKDFFEKNKNFLKLACAGECSEHKKNPFDSCENFLSGLEKCIKPHDIYDNIKHSYENESVKQENLDGFRKKFEATLKLIVSFCKDKDSLDYYQHQVSYWKEKIKKFNIEKENLSLGVKNLIFLTFFLLPFNQRLRSILISNL